MGLETLIITAVNLVSYLDIEKSVICTAEDISKS
jgi:hypothetical protein